MLLPFLLLSACSSVKKLPTHAIELDGHTLTVEVAADQGTRAQGLKYRDSMGENEGMIFIYPDVKPRSFWMQNTRIPLSIAFADKKGKIVKIAHMNPLDTNSTKSLFPAKYAIETNKGWFEKNGVEKGMIISNLPPVEGK